MFDVFLVIWYILLYNLVFIKCMFDLNYYDFILIDEVKSSCNLGVFLVLVFSIGFGNGNIYLILEVKFYLLFCVIF